MNVTKSVIWTGADDEAAAAAGWLVADYDGTGLLEIERLDEADIFEDDASALLYVRLRAAKGGELEQRALAFVATSPKEDL